MARGSVRKRGKIWYAYWWEPDGTQRSKAVGTNKKEAEAFVIEMQKQINDGLYVRVTKISFEDYAQYWLTDYASLHVKPSTLYNYRSMLEKSLIPFFKSTCLTQMTTAQVQKYLSYRLSQGVKPATATKPLTLLKGMLNQAVEWGYLRANPALPVKPPRQQIEDVDPLTTGEIQAFLNVLEGQWYSLFFTAVFTGMRLGELLALEWGDIDWRSQSIRVRRSVWKGSFQEPKTRNGKRSIGMSPKLIQVLREHQAVCSPSEHDLVFCSADGKVLDDANVRHRIFEKALKAAGIRKVRIHDLRHTYASLLINQGTNIKYVQMQLGHASITTTVDRYGHLMPEINRDVGARLDMTVFGPSEKSIDNRLTNHSKMETGQRASSF